MCSIGIGYFYYNDYGELMSGLSVNSGTCFKLIEYSFKQTDPLHNMI